MGWNHPESAWIGLDRPGWVRMTKVTLSGHFGHLSGTGHLSYLSCLDTLLTTCEPLWPLYPAPVGNTRAFSPLGSRPISGLAWIGLGDVMGGPSGRSCTFVHDHRYSSLCSLHVPLCPW